MANVQSAFSGVSTPTTVLRCFSFILFLAACVLSFSSTAFAVWDLTIETKTVSKNQTGVDVTIFGSWDLPVGGITVPIVVRSTSGGAFWTGALPYDTGGDGYWHPYQFNVSWNFTPLPPFPVWTTLEEFRPGVPVGNCDDQGDIGYDGVSTDHFAINATGQGKYNQPEPTGLGFVTWVFDVNGNAGTFEFDTACFSSSLFKIFMIDNASPPINHGAEATFNKGVISIQAGPCPDVIGAYNDALVSGTELDALTNTHDGNYHHPNGEAAAFYLAAGPGAVDVNTGEWSWTPGAGDDGSYTVEVEVSDAANGEGGCPINIITFDLEVAMIPIGADCGPDLEVHWGEPANKIITSSTPFSVTYHLISGPGNVLPNGDWAWMPGCSDIATNPNTVTIEVVDIASRTEQCTFDVNVTNQPPSGTVPNRGFIYTSPYLEVLSDDIINADGDPIIFSNLTITPTPPDNMPVLTDDEVSWAPSLNDALYNGGVYCLTVDASDGCDLITVEWELYVTTISDKVEIGTASAQALTPGIVLPIRIVTASPMWSIQLPLTARSVTGGAFWAGDIDTLPWEMVPEDAISNSRKFDKYPNFDRVSPDDFYLWGKAEFGQNHCLYTHDTAAYIRLRFDLNNNPGTFEIDTTFLPPFRTLRFLFCESIAAIVPAFIKGIVTVEPCDCPLNGDWNCDGRIDPLDVAYMVNYVYRAFDQRPCNPGNCFQNGDVNCDHQIDPLDCAYLAAWVYRPGTPPPCDPCTEW
jgi:hypothetical protein